MSIISHKNKKIGYSKESEFRMRIIIEFKPNYSPKNLFRV